MGVNYTLIIFCMKYVQKDFHSSCSEFLGVLSERFIENRAVYYCASLNCFINGHLLQNDFNAIKRTDWTVNF